MSPDRRSFLRSAAVAGVGVPVLGGALRGEEGAHAARQQACDAGKSVHSILEKDHPYIYIDPCMQMWPDADFHLAHRHGVTTYAVTAWDPHADAARALEGLMYWHGVAREHEGLEVIRTTADIRRVKREGKAGLLLAAQDGDWVGYELSRLQAFRDAGLRMMLLSSAADASTEPTEAFRSWGSGSWRNATGWASCWTSATRGEEARWRSSTGAPTPACTATPTPMLSFLLHGTSSMSRSVRARLGVG
jgi:hypothetical protein